ncbi:MAG TPA: hypothetical protein VK633_00210 [Verrucomicrobiae bacterium]|nr:hypothetical protein [Verrucomicrobiae bacterium]
MDMLRLITRGNLKTVLEFDPVKINEEDPYQVYALVWDGFFCERCLRKESYRSPGDEWVREDWIRLAAQRAKADGWYVGPWQIGTAWLSEPGLDCTAFCETCQEGRDMRPAVSP